MVTIILILIIIIIPTVSFLIWIYRLDPKCPKKGRCTGNVYNYTHTKYGTGINEHYITSVDKLYCKKCGRIYRR